VDKVVRLKKKRNQKHGKHVWSGVLGRTTRGNQKGREHGKLSWCGKSLEQKMSRKSYEKIMFNKEI